jgi:hypothetical protein
MGQWPDLLPDAHHIGHPMTTDPNCLDCLQAGAMYAARPLWFDLLLWVPTLLIFGRMTVWAVRANLRRLA